MSINVEKKELGKLNDEIQRVMGARLMSVQFILDYLILGFDEHGALTLLVWPEIIDNGTTSVSGHTGYRDKLCSLIGESVKSASGESDEVINILFDNGAHMRIPLKMKTFGERAILTGANNYLCVF